MTTPSERCPSLLIRLRNQGDQAAWMEFVEVDRPVICRLVAGGGMQHQQVRFAGDQISQRIGETA
jgi:hypothetical protein